MKQEFSLDMLDTASAPASAAKQEFSLDMLEPKTTDSRPAAESELSVQEKTAKELAELPQAPKVPFIQTEKVTPAELAIIAKNRGISVAELMPAVGWLGGYREQAELGDVGRTAVSKAAEMVPLGGAALQRGYKELYGKDDPKLRAAFDDLQELIDKKKSWKEMAAEFGAGLLTGSTEAKIAGNVGRFVGGTEKAAETAQKIYHGAQLGSLPIDMALRQREGEELFGFTLGGAIAGGISLFSKQLAKKVPDAMNAIEEAAGADIKSAVAASRAESKTAQDAAFNIVAGAEKQINKESEAAMAAAARKTIGAEDIAYIEKAAKSSGQSVDSLLAHRFLEDEAVDFVRSLEKKGAEESIKTLDDAKAAMADFVKKEGGNLEFAKARWELSRDAAETQRLVQKGLLKMFGPDEAARMENQLIAIKDGKYALRTIDRQLGTNAEGAQQELSSAYNTVNLLKISAANKINEINSMIDKGGADKNQLMRAMETNEGYDSLSQDSKAAVDSMRDFYKGWREFFGKELNFKIEILKDSQGGKFYVPHQMLPIAERIVAVKNKAMQAGEAMGLDLTKMLTPEQFAQLKKNKTGEELIRGLAAVTGSSPITPERFLASLHSAMDPIQNAGREATVAARALQREGNIPYFLRETDPVKLMYSWVDGTAKHVLSREPIAKLAAVRNQAAAVGNGRAADYLTTLIQDIVGGRVEGRMSTKLNDFFTRAKIRFLEKGNKYPEGSFRKMSYGALADAPQLFGALQSNLYPSYLGLNPRATLMNLLQVPTMTIPEVGPVYGSLTALRASMDFINDAQQLARGVKEFIVKSPAMAKKYGVAAGQTVKARSMADLLNNEGLISADISKMRPAISALEKGFRSTSLYKFSDAVQKQIAHKAMMLYQLSEFTNRAMTVNMADRIAEDMMQSRQGAVSFLKNVSSGPKGEIMQAIRAGNGEAVKELTRKYLLAKTIFNYDKATMSEFGRSVGPLLSIFTKWPTSIAGDVLAQYEEKGALGGSMQVAKKYLAPYIALSGIGSLLLPSPEDDGLTRMFVGRGGLGSAAPIGALGAFISGDLIKPPALQAAGQIGADMAKLGKAAAESPEDLASALPGALLRTGAKTIAPFTPGGVFIRMLDKDLPAYWGEDSIVEDTISSLSE